MIRMIIYDDIEYDNVDRRSSDDDNSRNNEVAAMKALQWDINDNAITSITILGKTNI